MKKTSVAIITAFSAALAGAANVLPTPGSSAGYLYFPAASSGTSGTGGSGGATVTGCYVGMKTSVPMPCQIGDPVYASSTDDTIVGKYAGGLDYAARHIIASLTTSYKNYCTVNSYMYAYDVANGMNNTNILTSRCGYDTAAGYCAGLGPGWYLPAKDELQMLYNNRSLLGVFSGTDYWSSTENGVNTSSALNLDVVSGTWHTHYKNSPKSALCTRMF